MTKERQIEEFQNDIIDNLFDGGTYKLAEALYNAGYRKVPKYAVILSAEERDEEMKAYNEERVEFDRLKVEFDCLKAENEALKRVDNRVAFCKAYDQLRAENKRLKAENKQLQEQLNSANAGNVNCSGCELVEINAVKEFAEKLKNHPPKNTKTIYWDYGAGWGDCWHAVKVVVDELLKEGI